MNELVPIPPPLELTATTPVEMQQAQAGLIAWCEQKITHMKHEAEELSQAHGIAKQRKWSTATLKRHAELAAKRVTYYEKIKAALEAGYCIVPNFPVTLFAIRTDKSKPAKMLKVDEYYYESGVPTFREQDAKLLATGEGEYKNPEAEITKEFKGERTNELGDKKLKYKTYCQEWDEIQFPINMARPRVMEAVGVTMSQKIFDELGILPDPRPKKDPLIVGHIIDPTPRGYSPKKYVTFIIAWHLNVRDL